MKEFWKDYGNLCKESIGFCKKHWKGVVVLNAVLIGVELAYYQYAYQLFDILNFRKKTKKEGEAQ